MRNKSLFIKICIEEFSKRSRESRRDTGSCIGGRARLSARFDGRPAYPAVVGEICTVAGLKAVVVTI